MCWGTGPGPMKAECAVYRDKATARALVAAAGPQCSVPGMQRRERRPAGFG